MNARPHRPHRSLPARVPPLMRFLFLGLIFSVFLTGVKLIPGIRNNFGPFEIIGGLFVVLYLLPGTRSKPLQGHPILTIQLLMGAAALLSMTWFQGPYLQLGAIQSLILIFQLLFVMAAFNFMVEYQISPHQLLRLVTYSALVVGPWILLAGLASDGSISEAGPFRNRAHMANYMLTAFWLVLLYNLWPGTPKRERLVSYVALASTLYPIAISGRRSVYLSLIIGLVGIGFSMLAASRGTRRSAFAAGAVLVGIIATLYLAGPRWLPQLEFFQSRVSGIGARLDMALGGADSISESQNFFDIQRIGVMSAFRENPVFGIGWGAFINSRFSPTGHEVHSTPLRFLAELGIIGLALYVAMMAILLVGSLRLVSLLRRTVYRTPALVLAIALWSLSVSYVYNRHVTERTFWLLLVFYVTFEGFARGVAWRAERAERRAGRTPLRRPLDQVAAAVARPR